MSTILDIVTTAAILYVVAAGLLLVFGVMKIINFAHGGFLTVGGYSALLVTHMGLHPWWAPAFAFVIGAVCGMAIERLVVRPLYARPLDAILATWGLGIIIGQVITLAIGREGQNARLAARLTGWRIDIRSDTAPPPEPRPDPATD